jgi:predicted nuclease of predicted toxin-antitoxin system
LKLLLDEMYPPALAEALRAGGIDACTVAEAGLAGRSDLDVMATAVAEGYVLLTENVADFVRIATDHLSTGGHRPGVLVALSSRFSRRPRGLNAIAAAVHAVAGQDLDDRLIYLAQPSQHE